MAITLNATDCRTLVHIVGYAERGGCERNCEVFIRHCPEYAHHVLVLGEPGPMSAVWAAQGATVTHLYLLALGWLSFQSGLEAVLGGEAFAAAIVWAGIRVPLTLAALAPFGRPVALHAGNPFTASARVRLLLHAGHWMRRPGEIVVIGCSAYVARTFEQAPYFRHLPIASCLNPVDIPASNPHRPRPVAPTDRVRIGMVARLDAIKDHLTLLQAFRYLRITWPQAELHLAGDGPLRHSLERAAVDLRIGAAVQFHGTVADVPAFLNTLDLFAYLTTAQEGMGNALAEALAHGVPSVVSDLEVTREVGGDAEQGAVQLAAADPVRVAERIDGMLRNAGGRAVLSERGYARAQARFAPRRVVERYFELLESPTA